MQKSTICAQKDGNNVMLLFWVVAVTLTFDHGLFGESIYGDGDMTQQQALFCFFR
jgi:hypothetical protein